MKIKSVLFKPSTGKFTRFTKEQDKISTWYLYLSCHLTVPTNQKIHFIESYNVMHLIELFKCDVIFNDINTWINILIYRHSQQLQCCNIIKKIHPIFIKYWQDRILSKEQSHKYRLTLQKLGNNYNYINNVVPSKLITIFLSLTCIIYIQAYKYADIYCRIVERRESLS